MIWRSYGFKKTPIWWGVSLPGFAVGMGAGIYTGWHRPSPAVEARARAGPGEGNGGAGCGGICFHLEKEGLDAVESARPRIVVESEVGPASDVGGRWQVEGASGGRGWPLQ